MIFFGEEDRKIWSRKKNPYYDGSQSTDFSSSRKNHPRMICTKDDYSKKEDIQSHRLENGRCSKLMLKNSNQQFETFHLNFLREYSVSNLNE